MVRGCNPLISGNKAAVVRTSSSAKPRARLLPQRLVDRAGRSPISMPGKLAGPKMFCRMLGVMAAVVTPALTLPAAGEIGGFPGVVAVAERATVRVSIFSDDLVAAAPVAVARFTVCLRASGRRSAAPVAAVTAFGATSAEAGDPHATTAVANQKNTSNDARANCMFPSRTRQVAPTNLRRLARVSTTTRRRRQVTTNGRYCTTCARSPREYRLAISESGTPLIFAP